MAKRSRPAPTAGSPTIEQLNAELRSREKRLKALVAKRERLTESLAAVNGQISELGGRGFRTRFRNDTSLEDALAAALEGKTMGVAEVARAVQKAGYQSTSRNFRNAVNQTLLKKRFKRVSRGLYTVR